MVTMERREHVFVTGVLEVISFDEESIIAETDMGVLVLRGVNLHVNKLNLENGDLDINGEIISLFYEEQHAHGKGRTSWLAKLFK